MEGIGFDSLKPQYIYFEGEDAIQKQIPPLEEEERGLSLEVSLKIEATVLNKLSSMVFDATLKSEAFREKNFLRSENVSGCNNWLFTKICCQTALERAEGDYQKRTAGLSEEDVHEERDVGLSEEDVQKVDQLVFCHLKIAQLRVCLQQSNLARSSVETLLTHAAQLGKGNVGQVVFRAAWGALQGINPLERMPVAFMSPFVDYLSCVNRGYVCRRLSERNFICIIDGAHLNIMKTILKMLDVLRDRPDESCERGGALLEFMSRERLSLTALSAGYTLGGYEAFKLAPKEDGSNEEQIVQCIKKRAELLQHEAYNDDIGCLRDLLNTSVEIQARLFDMSLRMEESSPPCGRIVSQECSDIPIGETAASIKDQLRGALRQHEEKMFSLFNQGMQKVIDYDSSRCLFFPSLDGKSFTVNSYNWFHFKIIWFLAQFSLGRRMCRAAAIHAQQKSIIQDVVCEWFGDAECIFQESGSLEKQESEMLSSEMLSSGLLSSAREKLKAACRLHSLDSDFVADLFGDV